MVRLPISEYVANYYREQEIQFTFRQQAHLCWAYNPLLKERLQSLREILTESDDEKLNMEIRQRIEYEENAWGHFMTNHACGCIYVVYPDNQDEYEDGYFSSARSAIAYGIGNSIEGYRITKRYLLDQCPQDVLHGEEPDRYNTQQSSYSFRTNGEIEHGYSYECPASFDEEDKTRFENMFLNVISPFGLGDIVMGKGFRCPGVVSSGRDCFQKIYCRHEKDTEICIDDTDNCIRVDFIRKDGRLTYDHVAPFDLWKVDSWEDKECWDILQFMSNAIKRGVDLIHFDYYTYEYGRCHKGEDA